MGLVINNDFDYRGKIFKCIYVALNITVNRKSDSINCYGSYYFSKDTFLKSETNSLEIHELTHEFNKKAVENISFEYSRNDGVDVVLLGHEKFKEELGKLGYDNVTIDI